jgi:hypothetical protein
MEKLPKKAKTTNLLFSLLFVWLDPGWRKYPDSGSGFQDKHLGSAILLENIGTVKFGNFVT